MRKRAEKLVCDIITEINHFKNIDRAEAELNAAVAEERSRVPPPDEIHRDGYNEGVAEEREKRKNLEIAARRTLAIYKALDENAYRGMCGFSLEVDEELRERMKVNRKALTKLTEVPE